MVISATTYIACEQALSGGAIRKNVKNLASEVKATILNITPYLTFLTAAVLFYWGVTIQSDCKFRVHVNLKLIKANK